MENTDKIALIIPLRLTGATYEAEARLGRICANVPRELFDIVISDYGTRPDHRGPIDALAAEGIRIVTHPSPHRLFSIGQARDFGVQMSSAPVIIFNDIDFLGTSDMYRAIHAEAARRGVSRNLFDFFCVPVLFLTEEGSNRWLAAPGDAKPFSGSLDVDSLDAARADIQSVAYGSSAMVVNRHHYMSLGGHDPRFSGHGAEDYDLLHRLSTIAPKGPRPHDYFTDYKDNGVRRYWGFRPFFALYGLDLVPRGVHLVHLWHPRRKEKGYFRPRRNFRLLKRVMKRFDRTGGQPLPLADLASGRGRWSVLYRNGADLDLLRQVLPLAAGYELIKVRSFKSGMSFIPAMASSGTRLVVATPDVAGDAAAFAAALPRGIRLLRALAPSAGEGEVGFILLPDGSDAVVAKPRIVRAPSGNPVFTWWPELALPGGLPALSSGTVPEPVPTDDPLLASFGEIEARGKRPARKKKSPLLVRLKRWFTGY